MFAFQAYIIAKQKIKMLEPETLLMLMNVVLYEYGPRLCLYKYDSKKWAKPHIKVF